MSEEPITVAIYPFRGITPKVADNAFLARTATVIGDVEIGERASLWFGVVARGDVNEIRIGAGTNIQDGTIIHVASRGQGTYVGEKVTVGHAVVLHACTIEDRAFIGTRATVLDGARVQSDAMVAAGALVTPGKVVPAGELWAGAPARRVRTLTAEEIETNARIAEGYIRLIEEYRRDIIAQQRRAREEAEMG